LKNIPFVLWMVLYPVSEEACNYLSYLQGLRFSDDVRGLAAFITLGIYIWVATRLYEKQS